MKRRNVIKGLALLPLAAGAITRESVSAAGTGAGLTSAPLYESGNRVTEASFMAETNIFRSIGV